MRSNWSQTLDEFVERSRAASLFFFVSFYLMNLHIFTFPTQRLSDFSINDIPLRETCRVYFLLFSCFFFLLLFLFCFCYLIFFLSTKLWMHLLSFGCSLGSHSRGFYFSCRCLHALSSISTFCGPVCFFTPLFATLLGPVTSVSRRAGGGRARPRCDLQTWDCPRTSSISPCILFYFLFYYFFIMWGRFWRSCSSCAS